MIARFFLLALIAMTAGCSMRSGGGLISTKGGDNGGPVHCLGARC